jgi:predicted MFS family arabinose efflux permease
VGQRRRGTAFGWYNLAIGIGALPASLLFGAVWDRYGPTAAFDLGAALAVAAAIVLLAVRPQLSTGARLLTPSAASPRLPVSEP